MKCGKEGSRGHCGCECIVVVGAHVLPAAIRAREGPCGVACCMGILVSLVILLFRLHRPLSPLQSPCGRRASSSLGDVLPVRSSPAGLARRGLDASLSEAAAPGGGLPELAHPARGRPRVVQERVQPTLHLRGGRHGRRCGLMCGRMSARPEAWMEGKGGELQRGGARSQSRRGAEGITVEGLITQLEIVYHITGPRHLPLAHLDLPTPTHLISQLGGCGLKSRWSVRGLDAAGRGTQRRAPQAAAAPHVGLEGLERGPWEEGGGRGSARQNASALSRVAAWPHLPVERPRLSARQEAPSARIPVAE